MTGQLHDGRESCHVGEKVRCFWKILLSEQFMFLQKCYFNVYGKMVTQRGEEAREG